MFTQFTVFKKSRSFILTAVGVDVINRVDVMKWSSRYKRVDVSTK